MAVTKNYTFFIVITLSILLYPNSALADGKISLKLYGGLSYLDAGDVNPGTQAFFDWGKIYFAPPPGGIIQGGYEAINWGYELGGDIIFQLSPKLGISIGAGYLKSSKNPPVDPVMMVITDNPGGDGLIKNFNAGTTLTAIPLRLGITLTLPIAEKFNFTAIAGVSCYLQARYRADWFVNVGPSRGIPEHPYQTLSTTADSKKTPIGFQGGLGIEYRLIPKAALFVEAQGRSARFHGLEGMSLWEGGFGGLFPAFYENGKLYYESVPAIPNEPRLIMVQGAPPNGPEGMPREAVVDFSGVSLIAGVKIRF
jgi:hypothetical protein